MSEEKKVRLDKWLWAARFYKTRGKAKEAIDGGKVHYDDQRIKPGKIVQVGAHVRLRLGPDERTVVICAISDKRSSAPIAQTLYQETEQSVSAREEARAMRKAAGITHERKPDKKQRRQIHRFKRINSSE
ncbi:MAG: heat-shock protein [Gammaproteobacteria bacterium]|nr:heat-shock protein [Gammaproteobacteria bacterium]NVK86818.1 heat-shock protein [Gammaproteobacteria bacterium]